MGMAKQGCKPAKPGIVSERAGTDEASWRSRTQQFEKDLHIFARTSLAEMVPGDIVFLDDLSYEQDSFARNLAAVLACPICGSPSLITWPQYYGGAPIVCTSKLCSGLFRILDEAQIIRLPPS